MALLPRDADLATGIDVAFLGAIGFVVVQFVRSVTAVPRDTLSLLRLSPDGSGQATATAPELGLLQPSDASAAPVDIGLAVPDGMWTALTVAALVVVVLGPLWFWFGRPYYYRR